MEMHQVRYFLAVCQNLSFTQAARKCHVTQPSLTRAIQLLEREFGGYLFYRERPRIHLTELGRIAQPYLQDAWDMTQAAKRQAKDLCVQSADGTETGHYVNDSASVADSIVQSPS
jgi:LysR family transcriptional regulator, hydrogen peroxide-inducible genes activator